MKSIIMINRLLYAPKVDAQAIMEIIILFVMLMGEGHVNIEYYL